MDNGNYGSQLIRVSHNNFAPECGALSVLNSVLKVWSDQACSESCFTSEWACDNVGVWAPWFLVVAGLSLGHAPPSAQAAAWEKPCQLSGPAVLHDEQVVLTSPQDLLFEEYCTLVFLGQNCLRISGFMNWRWRETDAKSELNCVFMKNLSNLWSQVYWPQGRLSS